MSSIPTYAIIIPTGRHFYLDRIINYYDKIGESSRVIVVDCSQTPWERTPPPGLSYLHLPGVSFMGRLKSALEQTDAQYISMCADDDFVFPYAIKLCMRFLVKNKDYSSAYGRYIRFTIQDTIKYNEQYSRELYRNLEDEDVSVRLQKIMSGYLQLCYAVHRREIFDKLFMIQELYDDSHFINTLGERIFTVIPCLLGKIQYLNIIFAMREQENHKCSRHLSYRTIGRSWVVCEDVLTRLAQEYGADSPEALQSVKFFVERGNYSHFSNAINRWGEPVELKDENMDAWLQEKNDPLSYITYRGTKPISSDFSYIQDMGLDDSKEAEETVRVADLFLKRFVRGYLESLSKS